MPKRDADNTRVIVCGATRRPRHSTFQRRKHQWEDMGWGVCRRKNCGVWV